MVDRVLRRRAARAEPVDLLAGAVAELARADPVQPDVPDPGHERQRRTRSTRRARPSRGRSRIRSRYQSSPPTIYFSTQIPSFADNQALETVLKQHNVVENATNPDSGPSFLESLIFGFGPTLLLVLLFVFLMRRAASAGGAGGLMSFGRSRARRVEAAGSAGHVRRRRRDRRGQGGADRDRRLPQEPRQVPARSAAGSRAACCCQGRPAPARRCSRARSRARRACRSSRCRRRSSSR